MSALLSGIELYMTYIVELCTSLLEIFGITILVYTASKCFLQWIRHDSALRLNLAHGIALSLEFKMGSEALRTVIVREWGELGILGATILLRGLLTFLIHWEIRHEKEDLDAHL